jgi:cytochrome c oxidase subunit 1
MPRRYPDYAYGYEGWNNIASFGSILTVLSVLFFLYLVSNSTFTPIKPMVVKFNNRD